MEFTVIANWPYCTSCAAVDLLDSCMQAPVHCCAACASSRSLNAVHVVSLTPTPRASGRSLLLLAPATLIRIGEGGASASRGRASCAGSPPPGPGTAVASSTQRASMNQHIPDPATQHTLTVSSSLKQHIALACVCTSGRRGGGVGAPALRGRASYAGSRPQGPGTAAACSGRRASPAARRSRRPQ